MNGLRNSKWVLLGVFAGMIGVTSVAHAHWVNSASVAWWNPSQRSKSWQHDSLRRGTITALNDFKTKLEVTVFNGASTRAILVSVCSDGSGVFTNDIKWGEGTGNLYLETNCTGGRSAIYSYGMLAEGTQSWPWL